MGIEDILDFGNIGNESIFGALPPEVLTPFSKLITILQVAGIIFITYIVFLLIKWFMDIRRYRKIMKIDKKVEIIDKKLDVLLGKKRVEELEKRIEDKKEEPVKKEKRGFLKLKKKEKTKEKRKK